MKMSVIAQQRRRNAMWHNGCNRVDSNIEQITTESARTTIDYFATKKRTEAEKLEERLYYTSTR